MRDPVPEETTDVNSLKAMQHQGWTSAGVHILQPELMKAIAICLVVLRHSFAPFCRIWSVSRFYDYNLAYDFVGHYVSSFSMPLFVSISGFTYSYLRNHLGKYPTYRILLKKKTKRLLLPYLVFAPLYIYFFVPYDSVASFLEPVWTRCGHLWFIIMLFLVFVFFYPLEKYFKRYRWYGVGAAAVLSAFSLPLPSPEMELVGYVLKYFPFFLFGYVLYCAGAPASTFLRKHRWAIFTVHLVIFGILSPLHLFNDHGPIFYGSDFLMTLCLGMLSIMFIFGLTSSIAERWSANGRLNAEHFRWPSYYIYLLHQPILMTFFTFGFVQALPPIAIVPLAFATGFSLSFLGGWLLLKSKTGRSLVGA